MSQNAKREKPKRPGLAVTLRDGEQLTADLPGRENPAIIVTAVESGRGRTRLHVHAPRDVMLLRDKVAAKIASQPQPATPAA